MTDNTESPGTADDAKDRSLQDDLQQLAAEARALAAAEFAYQKSRAAYAGQETRSVAILGVLAAALAFFALMALTVGLVIALTPPLTAWGATAVVCGGLLALALVCVLLARSRWNGMKATLGETETEANQ